MIPTSKEAMIPVLEYLNKDFPKNTPKTSAELNQAMIERFNITVEEQLEKQKKGTTWLYLNRIGWTKTDLKRFGYIQSPGRGLWEITKAGQDALKNPPAKIIVEPKEEPIETENTNDEEPEDSYSKYFKELGSILEKINGLLKRELLENLKSLKGDQFESVVRDLFIKMGYNAQVTQYTRDGGIDVLVSEDRLGLHKIFVQAKCYTDTSVGELEIRNFIGAVHGKDAGSKYVFVTTTEFAKSAIEKAVTLPVRLINGNEFVELMIEYELGIIQDSEFDVYRLDEDYFTGESW